MIEDTGKTARFFIEDDNVLYMRAVNSKGNKMWFNIDNALISEEDEDRLEALFQELEKAND